jgi:hypothetical protein
MPVTPEATEKLRLALQKAHQDAATDQAGVEVRYAASKAPLTRAIEQQHEAHRGRVQQLAQGRDLEYRRIGAAHRAAREVAKAVYRTETGEEPPE